IRSMSGVVRGMKLKGNGLAGGVKEPCEDCSKAKISRKLFSSPQHLATEVLQWIHSDVCGPMETKSIGGKAYFVLFTDEFTRFVTGYFMERKSEVFGFFLEFKAAAEKLTGQKIQALRSDGG